MAADGTNKSGTTIRLTFPVANEKQLSATKPVLTQDRPQRLHLLLVDDDPLLLKSLRDILTGDGHTIETANGGQAGIDAFAVAIETDKLFAAVITDLGMPRIDGAKVAAAIKERSPATPVILLTGWGQRLLTENDIPLNIDRVLSKPPKLHDLRAALLELCPIDQAKGAASRR